MVQVGYKSTVLYLNALHVDSWRNDYLTRLVIPRDLEALGVEVSHDEGFAGYLSSQEACVLLTVFGITPGVHSTALTEHERVVIGRNDLNWDFLVSFVALKTTFVR